MPKSITPSFVTEIPLIVSSQIEQELLGRFQAGRQLYNACLNEAIRRVQLIQSSNTYQKALAVPRTLKKGQKSVPNPERKKLFNQAWKEYQFSEYELHSFATLTANRSKWIAEKIDSNTQQKLATRAFNTAKKVLLGQAKKGQSIKGKRQWHKSKAYLKDLAKLRELQRKKTAYAKSQNRRIVNEILRHGKQIKTENVSVKGWQKRYGKAIAAKSPGFVQSELKRKAESAGGSFQKFSTRKTALSQTHLNGERLKKSLSQRVHQDITGVVMHRDIFTAYKREIR